MASTKVATTMASNWLSKGLPFVTSTSSNAYAPAAKWLFGTAGMVVGMIHVGGVTRLTQSGLSMTTWSPLGTRPPLTHEEWMTEFQRYQQFPEWQQRQHMTLDEFQFIYAWEYGHRMLGRTVGLCFALPWMYFTLRGKIPKGYQPKMVGLLTMGGTQGLVGWWMVKSGLGDDRRDDTHEIRVRPHRLAAHLSMAVATYGALVWTGLNIGGLPHQSTLIHQVSQLSQEAWKHATRVRTGALAVTGLTAITIVSGAFVAGNDAGRAYNTYPQMDGQWIPSGMWDKHPWYQNLTSNTATVQWNHRVLGTSTAVSALALAGIGGMVGGPSAAARRVLLTPQTQKGLLAVGVAATAQMSLGIATLLTYVPLGLAAAHQVGSIVVFTSGLYVVHSLRYVRPTVLRAAAKQLTTSTTTTTATARTATSAVTKPVTV
mmetsp:Transcript_16668/g.25865  ORF Transcript_16668/g.25865 Transcript_16668/m.25865 type:complete len:429 (+) Transcript_16668:49-1335(+)